MVCKYQRMNQQVTVGFVSPTSFWPKSNPPRVPPVFLRSLVLLVINAFSPQILERSIKLLFETRDISQVKQFVQRQCLKVVDGRASMQDLTFAKEYRGSGSYRPGACVPALELTRCVSAACC